jgi:hypothetical protein
MESSRNNIVTDECLEGAPEGKRLLAIVNFLPSLMIEY